MKSSSNTSDNKEFGFFQIPKLIGAYIDSRNQCKDLRKKIDSEKNVKRQERNRTQLDVILGEKRSLVNQLLFRALLLSIGGSAVGTGIYEYTKTKSSYEQSEVPAVSQQSINTIESDETSLVGIKDIVPIEPYTPQAGDYTEAMVELQNYWKDISLDALEFYKSADPRIENLINFLKEKAIMTIPVNEIVTMQVGIGDDASDKAKAELEDPHTFEIVFMPPQYAPFMHSSILTENFGRTVRIAANFKSKRWLGIMLAHELGHVEDQLIHGEDSTNTHKYNAGEVRSHLLENKLLRFWDPKTYDYFIDNAIPLYEEACRTNDETKLMKLIAKLYPVNKSIVSHYESKLANASCFMAVAFEDALRKGASIDDLSKVYVDVGDKFMQKK